MILKIGLPTAIGEVPMQLGFLLMSKNVFVYGTEAMAAYGIGNKVNGLITLPSNAIGSATAHYRGAEYGSKAAGPCGEGISVFHVDIGCIFVHRWYDLIKRYDFHGNCRNLFQGCGSCGHGGRLFKCYGILVLYQWRIQYDLRFVQGTGHTEVTMAIDVTRLWVFRFLTLWFCESVLHMGVRSVWYSVVISNAFLR